MLALKILAGFFLLAGFATVIEAKNIMKKFSLDKKVKLENEHEMDADEAEDYRKLKATVSIKLYGMLIVLPGLILTLIAFR